jgi:hypothetical protein
VETRVHPDTRSHHDAHMDADSHPEPGPAPGLEAAEGIAIANVNAGPGHASPNEHTVASDVCAARPDGVSDTDAHHGRGRERRRLGDRRDAPGWRRHRLGRLAQTPEAGRPDAVARLRQETPLGLAS